MKALICELCNSNDLVKENGVFVCRHCGTQYTVEEAKKLLIEGNVDVSGSTVKIDNSSIVEKHLQNARRSMQKEDWEEAEKYYNLVEQNEPTNIEALFYSAYAKAKASLVVNDIYKRQAVFKSLNNTVSIIDDNFDITDAAKNEQIIQQISDDICKMPASDFVYTQKTDGYGNKTDDRHMTYTLFRSLHMAYIETLKDILKKYPSDKKEGRILLLNLILTHYNRLITMTSGMAKSDRELHYTLIRATEQYHKELHYLDPTHPVPNIEARISSEKNTDTAAKILGFIMVVGLSVGLFALFYFLFS